MNDIVAAGGHRNCGPGKMLDAARLLPNWLGCGRGFIAKALGAVLGLTAINKLYERLRDCADPARFMALSLETLKIAISVAPRDRIKIPADGPLLVLANHPWGAPEALAIGQVLLERRTDVRFVGNYLLERIPELRPLTLAVDPFARRESRAANAAALRRAVRHLRQGGALAVFPAGEVAHFQPAQRKIAESPWSPHIASLARLARCPVLPVFFPGRSSLVFNLAGVLHPRLRTVLLPREMLRQQGRRLRVLIGHPIPWTRLASLRDDAARIDYLRFHTEFLNNRLKPAAGQKLLPLPHPWPRKVAPLAEAVPISLLRREIERLPPDSLLSQQGALAVHLAEAAQIPMVLREIGRLREVSFRAVNEGSCQAIDCDRYDAHYLHLFLWQQEREQIVGAYRIGLTDRILKRFGAEGLYTHSLFCYSPAVLRRLTHALELGRSFIRPEYQRHSASLSLLWRGIGELLARWPSYRELYGAVSIRQDYHAISKEIMVRFLRQRQNDPVWSRQVKPRCPFERRRLLRFGQETPLHSAIRSVEDLQLLVSAIENDGKGVPVLIRQYLKLNARFIGFNIDRRFSNVLDGLIYVDLDGVDARILKRFMGADGFRRFSAGTESEARRHGAFP